MHKLQRLAFNVTAARDNGLTWCPLHAWKVLNWIFRSRTEAGTPCSKQVAEPEGQRKGYLCHVPAAA